jgi:tetratricopeptide (TPR) repeat protein
MSFFRKVLGLRSAEELKAEADALLESDDPWAARPLYERAMDKAEDTELRAAAERGMHTCQDRMAMAQVEAGDRYAEDGDMELARQQFEGAMEIAVDAAIRDTAERRLEGLERRQVTEQVAATDAEPTDEDRLEVIASAWEPDQADEYEGYEGLGPALLALMDGRAEEAREALEALLEAHDDARYLWFEVGRARIAAGATDEGVQALRRFIESLDEDEGGDARLATHMELARMLDEAGDVDAAVGEYQAAIEALGDDPRPYLWLGRFLREKGHPAEAAEVIQSAIEVMDTAHPDWRVLQELGLAQADAGQDDEAIETLEQVVRVLTARHQLDFPPPTALTLAKLHEKQGGLERAADLYRLLSRGADREGLPLYHREAARVLAELGLVAEARRMLQRAGALVEGDPEALADIEQRLAALDEG